MSDQTTIPLWQYLNLLNQFNDVSRRIRALGMAVNEHKDGEALWERQREILRIAEATDPTFHSSAMFTMPEEDVLDADTIG